MRQRLFPQHEFLVDVDGLLVGRNQQVENLLPLGADEMFPAAEIDLQRELHPVVLAQLAIHQQVFDARKQVVPLIRLADEIIRTAFEAPDYVLRVGK